MHLSVTERELAYLAIAVDKDPRLGIVSYQLDRIFEQVRKHPGQLELGV